MKLGMRRAGRVGLGGEGARRTSAGLAAPGPPAARAVPASLPEGVVFAIGDETETGHIARLISSAVELSTPLTRKIAQFSKLVLWVIVGLAVVTFALGVARGEKPVEMFMAAVALAVGAIPEGLPAAVTIVFAIGLFTNRWTIFGALAMLGAQLLITYAPVMNRLFHSAPIGAESWLRIVGVAAVVYLAVEFEKWIRFGRRLAVYEEPQPQ